MSFAIWAFKSAGSTPARAGWVKNARGVVEVYDNEYDAILRARRLTKMMNTDWATASYRYTAKPYLELVEVAP